MLYEIRRGNKPEGPLSKKAIHDLLEEGEIDCSSLIREEGDPCWTTIATFFPEATLIVPRNRIYFKSAKSFISQLFVRRPTNDLTFIFVLFSIILGATCLLFLIMSGLGQPMHHNAIQATPTLFLYIIILSFIVSPLFYMFSRLNLAKSCLSALPLAVLIGFGTMHFRNLVSDSKVATNLQNNPTSGGWRWYIKKNGAQSQTAQLEWLPKAALVESKHSIAALFHFKLEFTENNHAAFRKQADEEIYRLHNDDLDNRLIWAIDKISVSALRSFKKYAREGGMIIKEAKIENYEENAREIYERANKSGRIDLKVSSVTKQANTEIHKFYVEALSNFKKQASDENPDLIPFFTRLLDWMEKHDTPEMSVIFNGPDSASVKLLDEAAREDHGTNYLSPFLVRMVDAVGRQIGVIPIEKARQMTRGTWLSGPSDPNDVKIEAAIRKQIKKPTGELTKADLEKGLVLEGLMVPIIPAFNYFKPEESKKREYFIANLLGEAFLKVFPNDIFSLQTGGGEVTDNAPSIQVDYNIRAMRKPDGKVLCYTWKDKPDGKAYIGVNIKFTVTMMIPGDEESFDFPVVVEPPTTVTITRSSLAGSEAAKATIYDTMAIKAFEKLTLELRDVFFREGSDGFEAASFPERRMLRMVLAYFISLKPETKTSDTTRATAIFKNLTSEDISISIMEAEVQAFRKDKTDPLEELEVIAEKLKNISAKKLVIKGAFDMADDDGGINDQEKIFIGQLMRTLELTNEQVRQMLNEK